MLDPRLLCALDEAGNVAALELLPEWATTGRGQGIQLLSVWHDQAQLVHFTGREQRWRQRLARRAAHQQERQARRATASSSGPPGVKPASKTG
jgi:hypothetical protein